MPFSSHEQEDLGRNTMTVHSLGVICTAGVMLPPLGVTRSPRKHEPTAGVEWVLGEQHHGGAAGVARAIQAKDNARTDTHDPQNSNSKNHTNLKIRQDFPKKTLPK